MVFIIRERKTTMRESIDFIESMKDTLITITSSERGTYDTTIYHEYKEEVDKVEQDLSRIDELEAKAKAFDVLKSKIDFEVSCGDFGYEITMANYVAPLTEEQYEILKKVEIE